MNKLDELIKELCPNGVEYKELGELGIFENIGVDKKINVNEKEILLLNYTDIYKNNYIDSSIPKMIVTANDKKIENCSVEECDIFITPTSETKEDIGHASVILETIPNCCYSYHIMRYRLINPNRVTASFIMYLFYSQDLKRQILKYAQGLTRYGLSKEKFSNLLIPFPNIRIQEEIVKVLDDYTKSVEELKGKLNEELTARKKQYSWYRDYLLKFENKVEMVKLGSIGKVSMCRRILKSETNIVGGIPFFKIGTFGKKEDAYISIEKFNEYKEKYSYPKKGMVLISTSGTIGRTIVFDGKPAYYQDSNIVWIDNNEEKVLNKYLYYFYQTSPWKIDMGGTIERLYNENIEKTIIPLPPLEVQKRIVEVLDNFEKICNDLNIGLPAEIEARQKQYEFIRNYLLTFNNEEVYDLSKQASKQAQNLIKILQYVYGYVEVRLGDISSFKYGYTDTAKETGNARFIRITDINENGKLKQYDEKYIDVNENNKEYLLEKDDILMARTGATYGKTLKFSEDYSAIYASFLIKILLEKELILPSYYWHFTQSSFYWKQANFLVTGGGQPQFNANVLSKVLIFLPSLEEQERIVDILDRFDKLCNDISEGLPAEIEARQKQYEYYREKLLTFKNIND